MEPEQIIMILIFLNMVLKRTRKKRSRKLCVHPIFTFRIINGAFFTLFDEPEKDERSLIIFQCVYHLAANYTMVFKIRFKKRDTKHGAMSYCQGGTCSGTRVHV
jgi:hypothetical protein